jgi:hypothetical protein
VPLPAPVSVPTAVIEKAEPPPITSESIVQYVFQSAQLNPDMFDIENVEIGVGATARVYRGLDKRLNQLKAFKRFNLTEGEQATLLQRVSKELRYQKTVTNEWIIKVEGWFRDKKGFLTMVLEYVEDGLTLEKCLHPVSRFSSTLLYSE